MGAFQSSVESVLCRYFLKACTMDNMKKQHESGEDLLLRVGLNDNKAGMEGLDKEKINRIIMEATKVCFLFLFISLITFYFLLKRSLLGSSYC